MFSHEARWDRHTPEQSEDTDRIDVGVIFKSGKMIPQAFIWHKRKYYIKEITYHWEEKRGGEILHFYTVSDGANIYQIYLNTKHMYWRLDQSCPL